MSWMRQIMDMWWGLFSRKFQIISQFWWIGQLSCGVLFGVIPLKEIAHRRTYLQSPWQCVWAQDWSGRVWQVRVDSICLCGKYLMHWILLSWAHLSSFPTLQLLYNGLKLFLKQHCDNYLPKCWVDLSSNSRVIVNFFLFWSKNKVDAKSVLKMSTTVRKRSKNVTALVHVNLWFCSI